MRRRAFQALCGISACPRHHPVSCDSRVVAPPRHHPSSHNPPSVRLASGPLKGLAYGEAFRPVLAASVCELLRVGCAVDSQSGSAHVFAREILIGWLAGVLRLDLIHDCYVIGTSWCGHTLHAGPPRASLIGGRCSKWCCRGASEWATRLFRADRERFVLFMRLMGRHRHWHRHRQRYRRRGDSCALKAIQRVAHRSRHLRDRLSVCARVRSASARIGS